MPLGNARNIAFWVVLFLMILALFNAFGGGSAQMNSTQISYSDFISRVENGDVTSVTIDGEQVGITARDGRQYTTVRPQGEEIADRLIAKVDVVEAALAAEHGMQPTRFSQSFDWEVNVKIPLVGGKIEDLVSDDIKRKNPVDEKASKQLLELY